MNVLDSSILIDYFDDAENADEIEGFFDEHRGPYLASAISTYEVFAGELNSSGSADTERLETLLSMTVEEVDLAPQIAAEAVQLQDDLRAHGSRLSARDAMIAGTAAHYGATLVTSDEPLGTSGVETEIDVIYVPPPE